MTHSQSSVMHSLHHAVRRAKNRVTSCEADDEAAMADNDRWQTTLLEGSLKQKENGKRSINQSNPICGEPKPTGSSRRGRDTAKTIGLETSEDARLLIIKGVSCDCHDSKRTTIYILKHMEGWQWQFDSLRGEKQKEKHTGLTKDTCCQFTCHVQS